MLRSVQSLEMDVVGVMIAKNAPVLKSLLSRQCCSVQRMLRERRCAVVLYNPTDKMQHTKIFKCLDILHIGAVGHDQIKKKRNSLGSDITTLTFTRSSTIFTPAEKGDENMIKSTGHGMSIIFRDIKKYGIIALICWERNGNDSKHFQDYTEERAKKLQCCFGQL